MSKYINADEQERIMQKNEMIESNEWVEVVRCKDCKYGIENGEWCGYKVYLCSAMTNPNEFYENFYCEMGERIETNE